jgi:hypothetical protein
VTRLFSPFGLAASAFDTASTLECSAEASLGASLGLSRDDSLPGCFEYAGDLRWGEMCLGRRPRGSGGGGVPRVANDRMHCRGSRSDHLAVGSIVRVYTLSGALSDGGIARLYCGLYEDSRMFFCKCWLEHGVKDRCSKYTGIMIKSSYSNYVTTHRYNRSPKLCSMIKAASSYATSGPSYVKHWYFIFIQVRRGMHVLLRAPTR